jgi:hypothetical protein
VKGLKYNDFRFIANQPITPADIAAVASTDTLASSSSSSSEDSLAAAKQQQQQQQQVEMQPQLPSVGLRWVAACCNSAKVSAASADTGLALGRLGMCLLLASGRMGLCQTPACCVCCSTTALQLFDMGLRVSCALLLGMRSTRQ